MSRAGFCQNMLQWTGPTGSCWSPSVTVTQWHHHCTWTGAGVAHRCDRWARHSAQLPAVAVRSQPQFLLSSQQTSEQLHSTVTHASYHSLIQTVWCSVLLWGAWRGRIILIYSPDINNEMKTVLFCCCPEMFSWLWMSVETLCVTVCPLESADSFTCTPDLNIWVKNTSNGSTSGTFGWNFIIAFFKSFKCRPKKNPSSSFSLRRLSKLVNVYFLRLCFRCGSICYCFCSLGPTRK